MRFNKSKMRFVSAGLIVAIFLSAGSLGRAQDLSQLLQNLTPAQQAQLIAQLTGTGAPTPRTAQQQQAGVSEAGIPRGKAAINYVRANPPGRKVNAARAGTPIFMGEMFPVPPEEPDYWDRIKDVFIEGLMQAILQFIGADLNIPFPTIKTAGE